MLRRLLTLKVAGVACGSPRRSLRIEQLPKPMLCIPLVLHWLYLAARYRSLTLPSCMNPRIETGGLVGESKSACLSQIDNAFAPWIAPWCRITFDEDASRARVTAELSYPLIAKPDIGWCGYGVRRVDSDAALASYAESSPFGGAFILQRLIAAPNEAGLLYIRQPGARSGKVTMITLRHTPFIIGDGTCTIAILETQTQDYARMPLRMLRPLETLSTCAYRKRARGFSSPQSPRCA